MFPLFFLLPSSSLALFPYFLSPLISCLFIPATHFLAPLRADMQGAFNQITSTLDEKTKTDTHPGIVTQATSAFQTGVHKVDDFLSDVSSSPIG